MQFCTGEARRYQLQVIATEYGLPFGPYTTGKEIIYYTQLKAKTASLKTYLVFIKKDSVYIFFSRGFCVKRKTTTTKVTYFVDRET